MKLSGNSTTIEKYTRAYEQPLPEQIEDFLVTGFANLSLNVCETLSLRKFAKLTWFNSLDIIAVFKTI